LNSKSLEILMPDIRGDQLIHRTKKAMMTEARICTFSSKTSETSHAENKKMKLSLSLRFSHHGSIPRVNTNTKQLGTSRREVKAYAREAQNSGKRVLNVDFRDIINTRNRPITFNIEHESLFAHPHFDALIITAPIGGIPVHRIMFDPGAYSSIFMLRTFKKMELDPADMRPCNDQIQGFNGSPVHTPLIQFFQSNFNVFVWKHEDMEGIDPEKSCHRLNVDRTDKPNIQKWRKFSPDRQKALEEE
ncbi:Unknown protein, partial [Striga hermonthica]